MEHHFKMCPKNIKNSIDNPENHLDIDTRISLLEENVMHLRKILNEEIKMRHDIVVDLGDLKRNNQVNSKKI